MAAHDTGRMYNDPNDTPSTISGDNGTQFNTFYYEKKALIEAAKTQFFGQLADVTSMPKNMGKKIKRYHYLPLLDDANVNSQGLGTDGLPSEAGNLYGSSKDVGTISGKMPTLSEAGGRVNRVGFKRKELEGTLEKFGFFDEYTQESLDFDTDADLEMHVTREMVMGANELTEDALQIDLLTAAGVVKFAGDATENVEMDGADLVTYSDLMRLSIDLDNNRTPKSTKVITGSRMVDTRTVQGGRIAYIGSELLPTFKAMEDLHGKAAWIPVQQYADAGNTVTGEEGSVDAVRFVVVPEMMKWAGAGDDIGIDTSSYSTNGKYDVFPILIVGDESFTTIGFQTDGKSVKFKITHKKPGEATADRNDPYGETGFMSIKWYYGFMALRPERIGMILTVARL